MANYTTGVGYTGLPSNVPLIIPELMAFMPRKKQFLQAFAGTTVQFLNAPEQKMKFMNIVAPKAVVGKNSAICDEPKRVVFEPPLVDETDPFYDSYDGTLDLCSIQPLVKMGITPASTRAMFDRGQLDPAVVDHLMKHTALWVGVNGWEWAKSYWLGHEYSASPSLSVTNIPGGVKRVGTMNGILGQIGVLMTAAGRAINTGFSSAPLIDDSVIDEMEAQLTKQGILDPTAYDNGNNPYCFHMTYACGQNWGKSMLKLTEGTVLNQAQTLSGETYRFDNYRGIKVIIHPEWDEALQEESGRLPNLLVLANSNQIATYAPNPVIAPAGLFPFTYQQRFVDKPGSVNKILAFQFEIFGGAMVGGDATGFEASW